MFEEDLRGARWNCKAGGALATDIKGRKVANPAALCYASPMRIMLAAALALSLARRAAGATAVISLEEDDGLPFVACEFDGRHARCLWDSGSARSNVPDEPPLSGYRRRLIEQGRDVVRVGSMRYGGVELGPDDAWRGASGNLALGSRTLAERRFDVTPAPSPSIVVDPVDGVLSPSIPLKRDRDDRIVVSIMLGGRKVDALWDTGTADTRVSRSFVDSAAAGAFTRVGEYRSRKENGSRYRLSRLEVGSASFADVEVFDADFSMRPVEVILGWDVIRRLHWRFDPQAGRWSASLPR